VIIGLTFSLATGILLAWLFKDMIPNNKNQISIS